MKNKIQIFTLLLIIVALAACRYDEGPMLSFRKVEDRVQKHFTLIEFTKDGVDMTQELADSCGAEWHFLSKEEAYGEINNIDIFPNPTTGDCTIKFDGKIENAIFYLISYDGIILVQEEWTENIKTIDMSAFPASIYLVIIKNDKEVYSNKIIKQ